MLLGRKRAPKVIKFGSTTLEETSEISITVTSSSNADGKPKSAPLSRFLRNGAKFDVPIPITATKSKQITLEGRDIDIEVIDDQEGYAEEEEEFINGDQIEDEGETIVCEVDEFEEYYDEDTGEVGNGGNLEDYFVKTGSGSEQVPELLRKFGAEIREGSGMMIYKCKICDKTFDQKRYLTSHMVSHTTSAQFVCTVCSRGFKRKQELRRHFDGIHAKVRPFKCKLCHSEFQLRYGLTRHLQSGCPKARKKQADSSDGESNGTSSRSTTSTTAAAATTTTLVKNLTGNAKLPPPPPIIPVTPQSINLLNLIQKAAKGNPSAITTSSQALAKAIATTTTASTAFSNIDMTPKTLAVDNGQGSVLLINLVPVPGPVTTSAAATITSHTLKLNQTIGGQHTIVTSKLPTLTAAKAKTLPISVFKPGAAVVKPPETKPSVNVTVAKQIQIKTEVEPAGDVDVSYESFYACEVCCQNFLTQEKLDQHKKSCKIQQDTARVQALKLLKSNGNNKNINEVLCDLCKRSFRDRQYLQMHLATCPGKIKVQPNKVRQQSGLSAASSSTPTNFKCNICQKFFTRKSDLKRHGLVHTKARPFVCTICNQSFQFNYVLYRHYLYCHPDEPAPQSEEEFLQQQQQAIVPAKKVKLS